MSRRTMILGGLFGTSVLLAGFAGGWLLKGRSESVRGAAQVSGASDASSSVSGPASSLNEGGGRRAAARYYCPMHPAMTSDRPGDCPICHMRMVRNEDEEGLRAPPSMAGPRVSSGDFSGMSATQPSGSAASPGRGAGKTIYRSTMNPSETSDRPGKDSMGMEMVPVEVDGEPPATAAAVEGLTTVRLSQLKRQLIGVRTTPVVRAPFKRTIHAVGRVSAEETREFHVTSKLAGYVEKLHANALGSRVRKGEPLLEIFSPEILASQQEYLLALRARERTASSRLPSIAASGDDLVASARRRLELQDISDEQIRRLEETGRPERHVTLRAPVTGIITHRAVTHGDKVEVGAHLLDVTDLSRVWVIASVYEYELPFVSVGQPALVTLSYMPGKSFTARVGFVYPTLEPASRTVQVRLELPNPGLALKPEMYAEVALEADLGERLSVPESAVLDTGVRSIAFVDAGDGFFEPRDVKVGLRTSGAYEVLAGLAEGERVLTSGNFFVDSESRLKSALAAAAAAP